MNILNEKIQTKLVGTVLEKEFPDPPSSMSYLRHFALTIIVYFVIYYNFGLFSKLLSENIVMILKYQTLVDDILVYFLLKLQ